MILKIATLQINPTLNLANLKLIFRNSKKEKKKSSRNYIFEEELIITKVGRWLENFTFWPLFFASLNGY